MFNNNRNKYIFQDTTNTKKNEISTHYGHNVLTHSRKAVELFPESFS